MDGSRSTEELETETVLVKLIHSLVTNFILDVGMEKEQKQELEWRVSVLPIPAFHSTQCTCSK